jgi:hypothetical protein
MLFVLKKICFFVTIWMKLEAIILNEISKVQKDKHFLISFIGEIENSLTHRSRE